jgi:hypothetical protein
VLLLVVVELVRLLVRIEGVVIERDGNGDNWWYGVLGEGLKRKSLDRVGLERPRIIDVVTGIGWCSTCFLSRIISWSEVLGE